jgi:hypothetical protein
MVECFGHIDMYAKKSEAVTQTSGLEKVSSRRLYRMNLRASYYQLDTSGLHQ